MPPLWTVCDLCAQLPPPRPVLVWNSAETAETDICESYECSDGFTPDADPDTECEDSGCTDDLCCTGEQWVSMGVETSRLVFVRRFMSV